MTLASEVAVADLMERRAAAIASLGLSSYGRAQLEGLLALAWLEGAQAGLDAGHRLFRQAVEQHSERV